MNAASGGGRRPVPRRFWVFALLLAAVVTVWFTLMSFGAGKTGVLVTSAGRHDVTLEIADTPSARETGLMNRQSMDRDHGMLFDFGEGREVTMWMENTYIPLDMVFMDRHGTVTHVAANAQPLSRDLIPSKGNVWYVLELNAGEASRLRVKLGDRLEYPTIPPL